MSDRKLSLTNHSKTSLDLVYSLWALLKRHLIKCIMTTSVLSVIPTPRRLQSKKDFKREEWILRVERYHRLQNFTLFSEFILDFLFILDFIFYGIRNFSLSSRMGMKTICDNTAIIPFIKTWYFGFLTFALVPW